MSTSIDVTPQRAWQNLRWPVIVIGVVLIIGVVIGIIKSTTTGGPLDPRSAKQNGARALSVLLEQRGVDVERVTKLDDALESVGTNEPTTLLIATPDLLVPLQLDELKDANVDHVVLLTPGSKTLKALSPHVEGPADAFQVIRDPRCDLPLAEKAGAIRGNGKAYRLGDAPSGEQLTGCYGDGQRFGFVRWVDDERTVDVVGTQEGLTNTRLDEEGHAAFALNLLGDNAHLVWYLPSLSDVPQPGEPGAPEEPVSLFSLLPVGVRYAVGMAAVGIALLMIARARRLGPVVPEPLPVVVRASEAVEGRARLYRRSRARDRAAAGLREATRSRLAPLLGMPITAPEHAVAAAAAARTGRPAAEVAALLGDPAGTMTDLDDAGLVRLADQLDALEQEVRRS